MLECRLFWEHSTVDNVEIGDDDISNIIQFDVPDKIMFSKGKAIVHVTIGITSSSLPPEFSFFDTGPVLNLILKFFQDPACRQKAKSVTWIPYWSESGDHISLCGAIWLLVISYICKYASD